MPEPFELNQVLKGKKILNIETATTPGWMVINFEPLEILRTCEAEDRACLTVFVGGRKGSSDDNYSSTYAFTLRIKTVVDHKGRKASWIINGARSGLAARYLFYCHERIS